MMKRIIFSLWSLLLLNLGCKQVIKSRPTDGTAHLPSKSVYDIKMKDLEGNTIDFSVYKGKKLLIINTASKCGYTPQYADLEKLHKMYGEKIVLLGFPANDFLHQEPGSNKEISEFCQKNYGVTFQIFEKVHVVGKDQCELYNWLTKKELNGWNDQAPSWNFCKYLVNEKGDLIRFYPSAVKPLSKELVNDIQN
jgi:glutathione peroxidase